MEARRTETEKGSPAPPGGAAPDVRDALAALARPRRSGTPGAEATAAELRRRFEKLGYRIRSLPFSFSTWPGRFGVTAAGAVYLIGVIAAAGFALAGRPAGGFVALFAVPLVLLAMLAGARSAIARLPWGRIDSANWLVHRPGARPEFLVLAHRDSKSQAVSLELRILAVGLALIGWAGLVPVLVLSAAYPALAGAGALLFGLLGLLGGVGLLACHAGNDSPGALDNATGLVALLGLARLEASRDDVAFVVTDGEELGLAGAWALAPQLPHVSGIINLDGLDDDGDFYIMERYGLPARGLAPRLVAALLASAERLGLAAQRRRLPLGLFVDHIPFAEAGLPALTVMRGTRASLRRAHRPDDRPDRLRGDGVAATVELVAGALRVLRELDPAADSIATGSDRG